MDPTTKHIVGLRVPEALHGRGKVNAQITYSAPGAPVRKLANGVSVLNLPLDMYTEIGDEANSRRRWAKHQKRAQKLGKPLDWTQQTYKNDAHAGQPGRVANVKPNYRTNLATGVTVLDLAKDEYTGKNIMSNVGVRSLGPYKTKGGVKVLDLPVDMYNPKFRMKTESDPNSKTPQFGVQTYVRGHSQLSAAGGIITYAPVSRQMDSKLETLASVPKTGSNVVVINDPNHKHKKRKKQIASSSSGKQQKDPEPSSKGESAGVLHADPGTNTKTTTTSSGKQKKVTKSGNLSAVPEPSPKGKSAGVVHADLNDDAPPPLDPSDNEIKQAQAAKKAKDQTPSGEGEGGFGVKVINATAQVGNAVAQGVNLVLGLKLF